MKLLLTVVALVAVAHGAPTTHTMEIGPNGVSGSILDSSLVQIIVNMIKDTVPETVNTPVEADPVVVVDEAVNPEPVNVVEVAQNPEPVNVVDEAAKPIVVEQPSNPIDVVAVNPIAPDTPEAVVLPAPAPAEVIQVPAPVVLPEPAPAEVVSVPEPVVIAPAPAEVIQVPAPVVLPESTPAEVVSVPEPVVVVPGTPEIVAVPEPVGVAPAPAEIVAVPEPVQVIEVAPETAAAEAESSGNQIINVVLNFIFGDSGALSSVEVPALPQTVTAPRV